MSPAIRDSLAHRVLMRLVRVDMVALFTAIGAIGTCAAAVLVAYQIRDANRNEMVSRANAAIWQLSFSGEILSLQQKIRDNSNSGTDYTLLANSRDATIALAAYLNALETVAAGVTHCAYDESVVHGNLARVTYKNVTAHVLGRSRKADDAFGFAWKAAEPPLFGGPSSFRELQTLYRRWFPKGEYTDERPKTPLQCEG